MINNKTRRFIRGLIDDGFQTPAPKFKQTVMERLSLLIPFDTALWMSGHIEGYTVHNVYLHNLPAEMMENWEKYKHQDRLMTHVMANPGQTCDVLEVYSRQERPSLEIYKQHSAHYGIEGAIATAIPDPDNGLWEAMSLYRKPGGPEFTARERALKQFAFPLMASVWHHNQIAHLKGISGSAPGQAAAVCDREGLIRHADQELIGHLKSEWPDWSAPLLPEELQQWLAGPERPDFMGKQIMFSAKELDDMILLLCKPRGAAALLTPREEQVARSFSAGMTYKEIALELGVSPSTARRHLESIYRKLGVSNKAELVLALGST
jgi:DNA-binding CsgD family transcriptional regulator